MGNTGVKLANLMREITYQHGGAFIACTSVTRAQRLRSVATSVSKWIVRISAM